MIAVENGDAEQDGSYVDPAASAQLPWNGLAGDMFSTPAAAPNAVVSGYVSFAQLLESAVHGIYQHLHILGDLLPRKTDSERKVAIAQFALRTRMLCIRLLAVLDWVSSHGQKVDRCAHIVNLLGKQGVQLIDSADKLADLSRNTLPNVCLPPFSVYQAVSVLVNPVEGLRLPACVRERFASRNPLTDDEKLFVVRQLNQLIETRLVSSEIPPRLLKNLRVVDGSLQIRIENEFEARFTLMSFEPNCPWRLLDLAIVVNDPGAAGGEVALVHRRQLDFICQLVQNRLLSVEETGDHSQPLVVLYNMLHSFCLSLQLELLHDHSNQLVRLRYTDAIAISHQSARSLTLTYWSVPIAPQTSTSTSSSSQATQMFSVTVVANDSRPFLLVDHVPALQNAPKHVKPSKLNMYWLLVQTLHCRAQNMLDRLMVSIVAVTTPDGLIGGGGAVSMKCMEVPTGENNLRPILRMDLVSPNGPTDQIIEVSLDARRGTLCCTNPMLPRQLLADFDASIRHLTFPPPPSTSSTTPIALPASFFSNLLQARTVIMLSRLLSSARRLGLPARIAQHHSTTTTTTPATGQEGGEAEETSELSTQQALWVPVGVPPVRLSAAFTCSVTSSKSGLADVCLHQLDSPGQEGQDASARPPEWFTIDDRRLPTSPGYACSRLNLDAVLATTYATLSQPSQGGSTDLILAHRQLVVSMSFCQQRSALASLELSLKRMGFQTAGVAVDWSTGQQSLLLTGVIATPSSMLSRALEARLLHCKITWELPRNERWFISAILISGIPVPPATLTSPSNTTPSGPASTFFPLVFHLDPVTGGQLTPSAAFDRTATLISYTLDSAAHLLSLLVPLNNQDRPSPITSIDIQCQRASAMLRYNGEMNQQYTVTVSVSRTPVPMTGWSGTSPSTVVAWHYSLLFGPGSPHAPLRHMFHSWFSRTLDFAGLLLILEETVSTMSCLRALSSVSSLVQLPLAMDSRRLATFLGAVPGAPAQSSGSLLVPAAAIIPMSPVLIRLVYHGSLAFSVRLLPNKFVHLQHCPNGLPAFTMPPDPNQPSNEPNTQRPLSLPPSYVAKILTALASETTSCYVSPLRQAEETAKSNLNSPTPSIVVASERFEWIITSGRLEGMLSNAMAFYSLENALREPSATSNIGMGMLAFSSRNVAPRDPNETPPLVLVNPVVQVSISLHLKPTDQDKAVFKILSSPPEPDSLVPSSPSGGLPPLYPYDCQILDDYLARDCEMSTDLSSAASTTRLISLLRILSQQLPVIRDFLSLMSLALQPEANASCRLWLPLTFGPGRSTSQYKTPVTCQSRTRIHFIVDLFRNPTSQGLPAPVGPVRLLAVYDSSSNAFMAHLSPDQPQSAVLNDQLGDLTQRALHQAAINQQTPIFPVLSDIAANIRL